MDWRRGCFALMLVNFGCGDDSGSTPEGTTGGAGTTGAQTTGADGGPAGPETTAVADSSSGTQGQDTGSGSSTGIADGTSTGGAIDCRLLAPIADPPDPQPMVGACGYALPMPNEDCGPQPVPGTQVCAAFIEAFDPNSGEDPEVTDWRCAPASSGGYCLELQTGLYSFCTMAVTTLAQYQAECIPCLIEVPPDGAIEISWQDGPVWTAPECYDPGAGTGSTGG